MAAGLEAGQLSFLVLTIKYVMILTKLLTILIRFSRQLLLNWWINCLVQKLFITQFQSILETFTTKKKSSKVCFSLKHVSETFVLKE